MTRSDGPLRLRLRVLWLLLQRIVAVTLLGGTVGSVASLATLGFVALIARAEQVLIGPLLANPTPSTWLPVLGSLLVGGLAVGLLRAWIAPARPQGVANVIGAAHGLDRLLSPAPGLKSALASLLSIGCGASVGQYGPLAHLGGLLGYLSGSVFGGDADRRRIGIACGTAAAISTAFQAPIAGIVFAHEVILRHYSLRAFAPVTLASSAGYILVHFVVGRDLSLTLPDSVFVYAPEYLYFAAIGVLGGALAVVMMRMVQAGERLARASRIPELLRPAAAGLLIALLAWSVPEVLGVGQQVLRDVLDGQYPPYALSLVLVAKLLATALCLGFGFVGGMFGPALLVGVVFGTLCGDFAYLLFEGQHTDLVIYAACGMVAVVSPVIGAPLSAILIIFELTRSYDATTAAMVSAVLSNLVSYRVFGRSFFDAQLARIGYDLSVGRERLVLSTRTLGKLVDGEVPMLPGDCRVEEARLLAADRRLPRLFVVDDQGGLAGVVETADLAAVADPDTPLESLANAEIAPLEAGMAVWQAMDYAEHDGADLFPVVEDGQGRLLGAVSRRALVAAYLQVARAVRREQSELG